MKQEKKKIAEMVFLEYWNEWQKQLAERTPAKKIADMEELKVIAEWFNVSNIDNPSVIAYMAFKAGLNAGLGMAEELEEVPAAN